MKSKFCQNVVIKQQVEEGEKGFIKWQVVIICYGQEKKILICEIVMKMI